MNPDSGQGAGAARLEEQVLVLDVPEGQRARVRLDVYITGFVENATRTKVQTAIREGRVTVNDRVEKSSYIVQPGDTITCRILKPPPVILTPQPIPLDILYEDEWLLVLNKPAGLVVHPAYGHREGTLVNALLHHIGYRSGLDLEGLSTVASGPRFEGDPTVRPGLVHRLDKDTSGVMLVAKSDTVHLRLARQFAKRTIDRVYWAILIGHPAPLQGVIETFIGRDPRDRKRMAVRPEPEGKVAVTTYQVLEVLPGASLVEFRLRTGRTHQIRVHAKHMGHPVLGDPVYGGRIHGSASGYPERRKALSGALRLLDRQALHAKTLGFQHPVSGARLFLESPLPDDMAGALAFLRSLSGESPGDQEGAG